jgi:hypothetical protein
LEVARSGMGALPRSAGGPGDVVVRPDGPLAPGVYPRRAAARDRRFRRNGPARRLSHARGSDRDRRRANEEKQRLFSRLE